MKFKWKLSNEVFRYPVGLENQQQIDNGDDTKIDGILKVLDDVFPNDVLDYLNYGRFECM